MFETAPGPLHGCIEAPTVTCLLDCYLIPIVPLNSTVLKSGGNEVSVRKSLQTVTLMSTVRLGRVLACVRYVEDKLKRLPPPAEILTKPKPSREWSPPLMSRLYGKSPGSSSVFFKNRGLIDWLNPCRDVESMPSRDIVAMNSIDDFILGIVSVNGEYEFLVLSVQLSTYIIEQNKPWDI